MKHGILKLLFVFGVGLILAGGTAWAEGNGTVEKAASSDSAPRPEAMIRNMSNQFIEALNRHRDKIDKDPREAQKLVYKYVLPHYDLEFTTRLILGRYWESATPAERKAFARAFIDHLIAVYEKGISRYRRDKVQVLPAQSSANGQFVSVDTLVHIPNRSSVSVDYTMHKVGGEWKIFDVKVMGVSFVLTYRNEYQAEIKRTSLSALIKHLQKAGLPNNGAVATSSGG